MEASSDGHEHCIDIDFLEKGCRGGNSRWYANFGGLAKLAFVTSGRVPFDVVFYRRPPEAIQDDATHEIETFVPKVIISISDQAEALRMGNV